MELLNNIEMNSLKKPVQIFSDCYLVSSIGALARSTRGKKILMQNVLHDGDGFRIRFQKVHSKQEDYFIANEDIANHQVYVCSKTDEKKPQYNIIISAIEIAMDRIIKEYPAAKPLISRLINFGDDEMFEYNYPSNFLEMFTGKKPLVLNEQTVRMNLRKNKEEAFELFERIDKSDDFSMVVGTGLFPKKGLSTLHCYTVEGVNSENQYLQIFDCRKQKSIKLSFDRAIKVLKYLTGYIT